MAVTHLISDFSSHQMLLVDGHDDAVSLDCVL